MSLQRDLGVWARDTTEYSDIIGTDSMASRFPIAVELE
jgi:hypothetical protein